MRAETREIFAEYLYTFRKKKTQKPLAKTTIAGILDYAKFIEETRKGQSLTQLQKKYASFLKKHNHVMAKYALWHYLKHLSYDERFLKDFISFVEINTWILITN